MPARIDRRSFLRRSTTMLVASILRPAGATRGMATGEGKIDLHGCLRGLSSREGCPCEVQYLP